MDIQTPAPPRAYAPPSLLSLGRVDRMTMGQNGSSLDGPGTFDQTGMGNNGPGDPTPQNP